MERNQGRRMGAEGKLGILEEGRQSGYTISETCRRHQVSHAQFYRWERLARQGALEALHNEGRKARNGKREDLLMTEVNRMHTIVVELTTENLSLKKGLLV